MKDVPRQHARQAQVHPQKKYLQRDRLSENFLLFLVNDLSIVEKKVEWEVGYPRLKSAGQDYRNTQLNVQPSSRGRRQPPIRYLEMGTSENLRCFFLPYMLDLFRCIQPFDKQVYYVDLAVYTYRGRYEAFHAKLGKLSCCVEGYSYCLYHLLGSVHRSKSILTFNIDTTIARS